MRVIRKMGILGPVGTHSEAAALYLKVWRHRAAELVRFADIGECIHAVETGEVDTAFVPVENSLEGAITVTLDVLAHADMLRVRREVIWPVHNYLMARTAEGEIRAVYSHAQPIAQCRDFLLRYCPRAEIIKTSSTARAAEIVGTAPPDAGLAAICTRRAGELNGLVGVNLTRIESRPARTELGAYIFYFDLDAHCDPDMLRDAIDAVAEKSVWLKIAGAFPVHRDVTHDLGA